MKARTKRRAAPGKRKSAGGFAIVRETLGNGLQLNVVRLPHVHRSALDVHVRVGSRFETPEDNGISHFHEHMLHRGIAGYRSAHAQALAFEELGAAFGAMTYVDHGALSCAVPTENLESALELTARLCEAPLFNDIEIEKGIVREELLEAYDGRGRLVDGASLLRQLSFGQHALGMPIAGTKATLASFDRPALRRFHRRHYVGRGLVVTVGGPHDPERMLPLLAKRFGGLPSGRPPKAAPPAASEKPRFRYVEDSGSQTWLGLAFRAPGESDADEPATELLMRILDDGNATRLYRTLSDEGGLCYDVSALYEAYADVGIVEVVAECAHSSAPRVLEYALAVLQDLARNGPAPGELERTKARFRWQIQELYDLPSELCAFVGLGSLTGVAHTPEARRDELSAVSGERVQAAAERIFRADNSSLVVVGKLPERSRNQLQKLQLSIGL